MTYNCVTRKNAPSNDNWTTPTALYERLDAEFHFTDDPCPLGGERHADGLLREWGSSVFINPPYSRPARWCEKAVLESRKGKTVVALLKSDTSTNWFHKYVLPFAEIRFIRGRVHYSGADRAPFPSLIAIWRPKI